MSADLHATGPEGGVHGVPWRDVVETLRRFVAPRVASPADADDVLQEVLLRIHRSAAAVEDPRRLSGWIHQIARRAVVDHHRGRRRAVPTAPDALPELPAGRAPLDGPSALDDALAGGLDRDPDDGPAEAMASVLTAFVDALPAPYAEALRLTELDGLTQAAAARRLGVSLPAMKSRVRRGRGLLRARVEDCCAIALDARGHVVGCEPRARQRGACDPPAAPTERP